MECKALDKNMERGAVFSSRQQWQEQLRSESQAPVVLVLALQLLALHLHKVLVSLPGRSIGALLKILQPSLSNEAFVSPLGPISTPTPIPSPSHTFPPSRPHPSASSARASPARHT